MQTEILFIAPMHAHSLHWLTSTGMLSRMLFADHVNPRQVKWYQRRAKIWQWGPDMAPTVSAHLSRSCIRLLALCGYMYTS